MSWIARGLLASALLALGGCVNEDLTFYVVDLDIMVAAPSDGPITIVFHHASQGEGVLEHPLGPIEETTFDGPDLMYELLYPLHAGTGLVLYGWQDTDGDGLLCAPGVPAEASGIRAVAAFPSHAVSVDLLLDSECRGPEGLYP